MQLINDSQLLEKLDQITLDYTFFQPLQVGIYKKYGIASKSDYGHYEILLQMMSRGLIPDDYQVWQLLNEADTFQAAGLLATHGDMIFQLCRLNEAISSTNVLYSPEKLTDYQKIRLRLWNEYFQMKQYAYQIRRAVQNQTLFYETEDEVEQFLHEQQILDDGYMKKLVLKFPNYEEL